MATLADNIESMAALVKKIKTDTRLSEQTILTIVHMNLEQADRNRAYPPVPTEDEDIPFDEGDEDSEKVVNLTPVPDPEPEKGEDAVVDAATEG
ncbi:MAG TPA: hypothetical protein VF960_12555 [Chloroflexota bacterium]